MKSNRKKELAEALVAIYGEVSKIVNAEKDDKERVKLKDIMDKMEKSALTELVSLI